MNEIKIYRINNIIGALKDHGSIKLKYKYIENLWIEYRKRYLPESNHFDKTVLYDFIEWSKWLKIDIV
jgi:hypothetical protein